MKRILFSFVLPLALAVSVIGCTPASKNAAKGAVAAAGSAAKACGEAQLGVILPDTGKTLLQTVEDLMAKNDAALEQDLDNYLASLGSEALKCAITSGAAALTSLQGSGVGMVRMAVPSATLSGIARAQAWAAKH